LTTSAPGASDGRRRPPGGRLRPGRDRSSRPARWGTSARPSAGRPRQRRRGRRHLRQEPAVRREVRAGWKGCAESWAAAACRRRCGRLPGAPRLGQS